MFMLENHRIPSFDVTKAVLEDRRRELQAARQREHLVMADRQRLRFLRMYRLRKFLYRLAPKFARTFL
jgi:hypothetical protein